MDLFSYPMTAALQAHDAVEKAGQLNKQKDEGTLGNAKRYLAKLAGEKQPSPAKAVTPEERMSQLLNEVHEHLKATNPESARSAQKQAQNESNTVRSDVPIVGAHSILTS